MRMLAPKRARIVVLLGILLGAVAYKFASAGPTNGVDLSNSLLPREQI